MSYFGVDQSSPIGATAGDSDTSSSSTVTVDIMTTVANSAVRPIVSGYVANLRSELKAWGMDGKLNLLRSDGGLMSADKAEQAPVNLLMSGPAGGVAGALWVAKNSGHESILTIDMGGTSTSAPSAPVAARSRTCRN